MANGMKRCKATKDTFFSFCFQEESAGVSRLQSGYLLSNSLDLWFKVGPLEQLARTGIWASSPSFYLHLVKNKKFSGGRVRSKPALGEDCGRPFCSLYTQSALRKVFSEPRSPGQTKLPLYLAT